MSMCFRVAVLIWISFLHVIAPLLIINGLFLLASMFFQ